MTPIATRSGARDGTGQRGLLITGWHGERLVAERFREEGYEVDWPHEGGWWLDDGSDIDMVVNGVGIDVKSVPRKAQYVSVQESRHKPPRHLILVVGYRREVYERLTDVGWTLWRDESFVWGSVDPDIVEWGLPPARNPIACYWVPTNDIQPFPALTHCFTCGRPQDRFMPDGSAAYDCDHPAVYPDHSLVFPVPLIEETW